MPSKLPARAGPPRGLAWATVAALFTLMTLGNVVSATGSGLACPDWPLCHGRLVPPLRPDVLLEYGHRLAAAVTSVLLVATIMLSMRRSRVPGTRGLGITLLVMLAAQIGLGGITVLLRLPHLISTAHLVNALLILAGLLALCGRPDAPRIAPDRVRRLAMVGVGVLLFQLALGGYVRHAGAGLACPDFPLCAGAILPDRWLGVAHWGHRWLGIALLGLFVHLAVAARGSTVSAAARLALGLALIQVTLGIVAVLLRLDPPVRAAHAATAYALWSVLVWIALRSCAWPVLGASAHHPPERLTRTVRAS